MNYGYYFDLEESDKKELEHILSFNGRLDFKFYLKNWDYIKKEIKKLGYVKDYEKKYNQETEIVYKKNDKQLQFYI